MKVKPLNDRVLIKRVENETVSAGGIIIPDTAKEKPMRGEVIAVGPGKRAKDGTRRPMSVSEGNIVIFGKYSGTEVKIDGDELLLVGEDEIFAIVD